MACSNCFNGCADITSDQCVKYTGVPVPGLGIETGDPLLVVENKITDKILELMDGSGVYPTIAPADVCALVQGYLPCCPPLDLNQVITALIKSICSIDTRLLGLEGRMINVEGALVALNADYTIPSCITGVTASSDTHAIVQAAITKICLIEADLHSNYTRTDELDNIIGAYISGQAVSLKYNSRMIPWVAYPIFFIPNGAFDINGVGIPGSAWENIYLCQGRSKTGIPDLRGLVIVGSNDMAPAPYDPITDPTKPGNHIYEINGPIYGVNVVPLTIGQLPNHSHAINVLVNQTPHNHAGTAAGPYIGPNIAGGGGFSGGGNTFRERNITLQPASVGLNITATATAAGAGEGHPNIQPGKGAYYIMYIP